MPLSNIEHSTERIFKMCQRDCAIQIWASKGSFQVPESRDCKNFDTGKNVVWKSRTSRKDQPNCMPARHLYSRTGSIAHRPSPSKLMNRSAYKPIVLPVNCMKCRYLCHSADHSNLCQDLAPRQYPSVLAQNSDGYLDETLVLSRHHLQ